MRTKLFLFALLSFFATKMNAQCSALFNYTTNPGGVVVFNASGGNVASTLYSWSFGNGASGTGQVVSTTYNGPGPFVACLTVTDTFNINGCTTTWCDTVVINGGFVPCSGMPSAGNAIASNNSPQSGTSIVLSLPNATSGSGITYQWQRASSCATNATWVNLAGQTSSTSTQTIVGTKAFRCIVNCTNSGQTDTSASTCVTAQTSTTSCISSFTYNYNSLLGNIGFTANTTGNASTATYSWYNGNTLMANGANYTTAISPGTYNICLFVEDSVNNCIDSSCQTVTIANPNNCNASFYIYPDTLGAPHTYIGVNNSSNGASVYSWSWGDGTTSTGQFPSHTYASAGNYVICLTVGVPGTTCYDTMCTNATINKTTAMYSVNFGTPTSVNSVAKELATIYPNPAKDNFTIKGLATAKYQVEIMNLNGSILKSISANGNQAIDISNLASNLYVLKITNQNGETQFAKLIKD